LSQTNFIPNILNIKDKNIVFEEEFYTEEVIKGIGSKVFHGRLTYTPKACSKCGVKFDKDIIKHGFKTSRIKVPDVSNFVTYLKLKKQRYLCRHCNSTFTLSTTEVNKHCFISNNTKLSIALNARDKISEKDIALRHNVSA
jgi:transposase